LIIGNQLNIYFNIYNNSETEKQNVNEFLESCSDIRDFGYINNLISDIFNLVQLFSSLCYKYSFINDIYKACGLNITVFMQQIKEDNLSITLNKSDYSFHYFDHFSEQYLKQIFVNYLVVSFLPQFDVNFIPFIINE
jgi:hypothetical protein